MAILQLVDVEKHFGGLPAVDGVSFTVDEGEIVALVGPNGAGKSTLLKMIGGMHAPTSGSIRFGGAELSGAAAHTARHAGVAMVLQTPRPFATMSVAENVTLGALFGGGRIREPDAVATGRRLLDFVGLADRADDPISALNLHDQRFLEIARQLAGNPKLILLDEVMAGLNDTELQSSIEMIRRVRDELATTVVWVEHVMKAVMSLAERVMVLNFGRLIADGTPTDVMTQPDVVTAYLGERGSAA